MTEAVANTATGDGLLSFDHAVIVVPELELAIENFTALGFSVQRGGSSKPAHNALIYFSDGTYIELITLISKRSRFFARLLYRTGLLALSAKHKPSLRSRFMLWFGGPEGLRDWCVRCTNIENTVESFRAQGVETFDPNYFSRQRPDDKLAEWRLAGPAKTQLPFFIEDISPTAVRVPFEKNCDHPNGATGIAAVIPGRKLGQDIIKTLQPYTRSNPGSNGEACLLGSVELRVATRTSAADLALELHTAGHRKGPLAANKTFGASITLI